MDFSTPTTCLQKAVILALLIIPFSDTQAQTRFIEIGSLPPAGLIEPVYLAPITLTETSADAWKDRSFTLQWEHSPNPDQYVYLQPEPSASASVGSAVFESIGDYGLTVNVDADDQLIDSIILRAVIEPREDADRLIGLDYALVAGNWTVN